jgi:hypothetical protein
VDVDLRASGASLSVFVYIAGRFVDKSNGSRTASRYFSYEGQNAMKPHSMITVLFDVANQSQFPVGFRTGRH